MDKVNFYIDGFNIYHAIDRLNNNKLKWINYYDLCKSLLKDNEIINKVYYFSAYAFWKPYSQNKHYIFIQALKYFNVEVVLGNFKKKSKNLIINDNNGNIIKYNYEYHEEKESDVNIAIYLVRDACNRNCDKAILLSGDSDLVPAIKMAKEENADLKVGVVVPPNVQASSLKNISDFDIKLLKIDISSFLLPNSIKLETGHTIICPKDWQ
ncbi:NYN domain-containing protein [Brachyspira hampsonii]|uniref:NYN domain-containing protein n=1 Tax=Brachyspira hampsonii TaxID=1287055 RepID=UPI001C6667D2|nr:NYN domain-containing protein [Brachyspira hampsonii]MBW5389339.1 NYN domain-containing protein [Brachyspira hampsonii]